MVDNISLFSLCDSNFQNVFEEPPSGSKVSNNKQNYLCKFDNCNKTFAHYSSRNRHYSKHHSQVMEPKKDDTTTTNNNNNYNNYDAYRTTDMFSNHESSLFNNNNVTVNSAPAGQQQQQPQIRVSPKIMEAINLCQSFFNRENNAETAISFIKGSRVVQENAVEMR